MRNFKKMGSFLFLFLWLVLIFSLSLQSAAHSTAVSRRVLALLHETFPGVLSLPSLRAAAHIAEFAVLGALLFLFFSPVGTPPRRAARASLLFGGACAVCDECLQLLPTGRTPEAADCGKDMVGLVLGILFAAAVCRSTKKRREFYFSK